jgi:hypothetical protein
MVKIEEYTATHRTTIYEGDATTISVEQQPENDGDTSYVIRVEDTSDDITFVRNPFQTLGGLEGHELLALRDCINTMLGEPAPKATPPAAAVDLKKANVADLDGTVYMKGRQISSGVLQKGDEFRYYKDSIAYRIVSDPFDGPAGQKAAWIVPLTTQPMLLEDDGEID